MEKMVWAGDPGRKRTEKYLAPVWHELQITTSELQGPQGAPIPDLLTSLVKTPSIPRRIFTDP